VPVRPAGYCQFDPQDIPTLQDLTKQLNGAQVLTDPTAGPFGQRLKENAPDAPIGVPLLIGQGLADLVVYPEVRAAGPDDVRTCVSHGRTCANGSEMRRPPAQAGLTPDG
jgi:hypothetical protein